MWKIDLILKLPLLTWSVTNYNSYYLGLPLLSNLSNIIYSKLSIMYPINSYVNVEEVPKVYQSYFEVHKIFMWKKSLKQYFGDITFWANINSLCEILEYLTNTAYQIYNHCQRARESVFPINLIKLTIKEKIHKMP